MHTPHCNANVGLSFFLPAKLCSPGVCDRKYLPSAFLLHLVNIPHPHFYGITSGIVFPRNKRTVIHLFFLEDILNVGSGTAFCCPIAVNCDTRRSLQICVIRVWPSSTWLEPKYKKKECHNTFIPWELGTKYPSTEENVKLFNSPVTVGYDFIAFDFDLPPAFGVLVRVSFRGLPDKLLADINGTRLGVWCSVFLYHSPTKFLGLARTVDLVGKFCLFCWLVFMRSLERVEHVP